MNAKPIGGGHLKLDLCPLSDRLRYVHLATTDASLEDEVVPGKQGFGNFKAVSWKT